MLCIFDWDGTLCDSTGLIVKCIQLAAAELGFEALDDYTARQIIGLGLRDAILALYPAASDSDIQALAESYSRHFLAQSQSQSLFTGAFELIELLKASGHEVCIATGKSRAGLDRVLDQLALTQCFDATRCADETASKPNPLMLHELLEEFGREPKDAVMVGDTTFDINMAQRAQMPNIAVSWGAHDVSKLRAQAPDSLVSSMTSLSDLLLR